MEVRVLFGGESEQGCNISYLVELGILLHIKHLDIAADHPRQNGLAHIDYFARGLSPGWAKAHEMAVEMSATPAPDRIPPKVLPYHPNLHLSHSPPPKPQP